MAKFIENGNPNDSIQDGVYGINGLRIIFATANGFISFV